jgi:hypothetical protein
MMLHDVVDVGMDDASHIWSGQCPVQLKLEALLASPALGCFGASVLPLFAGVYGLVYGVLMFWLMLDERFLLFLL